MQYYCEGTNAIVFHETIIIYVFHMTLQGLRINTIKRFRILFYKNTYFQRFPHAITTVNMGEQDNEGSTTKSKVRLR